MLHGSETWALTAANLQRPRRNDRSMICWICGCKPVINATAPLLEKLGLIEITHVLRACRLRWYGHVKRASACINTITVVRFSKQVKKRILH